MGDEIEPRGQGRIGPGALLLVLTLFAGLAYFSKETPRGTTPVLRPSTAAMVPGTAQVDAAIQALTSR